MHIGRLIKQQLEAQDKTVSWLARELAYCRTNIYKIFDKKSIDTDLLATGKKIFKVNNVCGMLKSDYYVGSCSI